MKAERRHDLKTNALARGIEEMPNHWRDYGSKLLLMALVAVTVFLVVRYWTDKKNRDAEQLVTARQTIQSELQELEILPFRYSSASPTALLDQRQEISTKADQAITTLLASSKLPADQANGYLARGDLNWKLANLPELPGADTQPALKLQNRDGLLDQAQSAYETVAKPEFGAAPGNVFYARLGLAAIAENKHQWDAAKVQYQSIVNSANMPESFKEYAKTRLTQLPSYETDALIVAAPVTPIAPTTHATTETFGPVPLPAPTTKLTPAPTSTAPTTTAPTTTAP
jgi:predicted negative regulator of RcsB-dependent stress response